MELFIGAGGMRYDSLAPVICIRFREQRITSQLFALGTTRIFIALWPFDEPFMHQSVRAISCVTCIMTEKYEKLNRLVSFFVIMVLWYDHCLLCTAHPQTCKR